MKEENKSTGFVEIQKEKLKIVKCILIIGAILFFLDMAGLFLTLFFKKEIFSIFGPLILGIALIIGVTTLVFILNKEE